MSAYYFYKNESHLYVYKKPFDPLPTDEDQVNENLGRLHLHLNKVKPLLVNCTVAPLAEECLSSKNRSSNGIDQWIDQFIEQHAYSLIMSLLLLVVFIIIAILSIRTFIQTIRKYRSRLTLTNNYDYYTLPSASSIDYYEVS